MAELVQEVMTAHPTSLAASLTMRDAARTMGELDIGDVIVVEDDGRLCGIVTDRDIVVRSVAEDKSPSDVRLGEICSRDLTTIGPDASVKDAVALMRQKALRRVLVLDHGRPTGIISLGDLAVERDPGSALADISVAPANT